MKNIAFLLALHTVEGLGPIRLKKLVDHFGDPKLIWLENRKTLKELSVPEGVIDKLEQARQEIDPDKLVAQYQQTEINWLTIFDEDYPPTLKQIYDPPVLFYFKGEIKRRDNQAIAVVGTRKVTGYGRAVTEKFTYDLATAGLTIVSGLARGVDSIAHRTAIDAGGRTIAVLGGGLNKIFPPENVSLVKKIIAGSGAVISEFPPDYPSLPGNFPTRNRIIAGMSRAVLVTEAAEDSGSLITARLALECGREVFAIPGPITSNLSKGPADLIKEGATLAFEPADLLQGLGIDQPIKTVTIKVDQLSSIEQAILKSLEEDSKHIDELVRQLQMSSATVSAALIKMEIAGLVKSLGGGQYTRVIGINI